MVLQIGETSEGFRRYAAYFTPAPGPLADFGARWLGWDLASGRDCRHPQINQLPRAISEITKTPRKYGFHATIKPPFRLEAHSNADALAAALEVLTDERAPVILEGLAVTRLGDFVALTPTGDVSALNALASYFVRGLDHFRAPADAEELARRRAKGLTAQQDLLLEKWGYPYVLDAFRFHMTLSGRLPEGEAETLRRALMPEFARLSPGRFAIDAISLVGEADDGRFHLVHRYPLKGNPAKS